MNRFLFSLFSSFLAQAVHGPVNEFQLGEETIKIPTPTGFKRMDQLKDLAKEFSGKEGIKMRVVTRTSLGA